MLVEELDGALEAGELHHGVGDFMHPERREALVEAAEALLLPHLWRHVTQQGLQYHLEERQRIAQKKKASESSCLFASIDEECAL